VSALAAIRSQRGFETARRRGLVGANEPTHPALLRAAGLAVQAVDRDLPRVFDIDDATKVKLTDDDVADIGKVRALYDAVSAGLFVMAPSLSCARADVAPSLTEGVTAAAPEGLLVAHDVASSRRKNQRKGSARLRALQQARS
jgi:hypothetical protein